MGVAVKPSRDTQPLESGHARGTTPEKPDEQARVPIIGLDAGCIPGTKPGCSARELERAGRDIVRARLHRNRFKPGDARRP